MYIYIYIFPVLTAKHQPHSPHQDEPRFSQPPCCDAGKFQTLRAWDFFAKIRWMEEAPSNGCFIMENPNLKWMMTGGTPILGNDHLPTFPLVN